MATEYSRNTTSSARGALMVIIANITIAKSKTNHPTEGPERYNVVNHRAPHVSTDTSTVTLWNHTGGHLIGKTSGARNETRLGNDTSICRAPIE